MPCNMYLFIYFGQSLVIFYMLLVGYLAKKKHIQSNQFVVKQKMYEDVKERVEHVVNIGKVDQDQFREVFDLLDHKFTPQDHPSIIKVKFNISLYMYKYILFIF